MLDHLVGFLHEATSYQAQLRDVFVDRDAGESELVAVAALASEQAQQLVDECEVVDRNGELDVAAVAGTA